MAVTLSASAAAPPVPSPTSCTGNIGNSAEPEIFYVNGVVPPGAATPQCATILPASGVILAGDTIGAIYSDESTINAAPGFLPSFSVDGLAQPITLHDIIPPQAPQGFQTSITITVPANLFPGLHTAIVQAWDSDQSEGGGGDFGQVIFTFGVSDASIKITPSFNAHDEKALRALETSDATLTAPGGATVHGAEASTGYGMAWLNAFRDARMVIRNETITSDTIVQEFTFQGTHTATLSAPTGDIPATNRRLSGRGVQVLKVRDGLIADTQLYFDQVDVLTQLGLMPDLAAAAR